MTPVRTTEERRRNRKEVRDRAGGKKKEEASPEGGENKAEAPAEAGAGEESDDSGRETSESPSAE